MPATSDHARQRFRRRIAVSSACTPPGPPAVLMDTSSEPSVTRNQDSARHQSVTESGKDQSPHRDDLSESSKHPSRFSKRHSEFRKRRSRFSESPSASRERPSDFIQRPEESVRPRSGSDNPPSDSRQRPSEFSNPLSVFSQGLSVPIQAVGCQAGDGEGTEGVNLQRQASL